MQSRGQQWGMIKIDDERERERERESGNSVLSVRLDHDYDDDDEDIYYERVSYIETVLNGVELREVFCLKATTEKRNEIERNPF